jgi:hypothetical protein
MVIISNDARALADRKPREGASVVATPLDLITELDRGSEVDTIVVLDGVYAGCRELALVLMDLYPWVRVVDGDPDTTPTTPDPTSCGISLTAS